MATICFIFCTTTVLVALLLHHRHHKIKRKGQVNAPTAATTNTTTTADFEINTCTSNATRNYTSPMQQNICYSVSVKQENRDREIDGSYQYSYPYLRSTSLADVTGVRIASESRPLQGNPGQGIMIRAITAGNRGEMVSGENVTMKQRSCDNEEDIYSYII
jgi:hypothetical protein